MGSKANRNVYFAVLGVAVIALIADRTLFDGGLGPESAHAAAGPQSINAAADNEQAAPKPRLSERVAEMFDKAATKTDVLIGATPEAFDPTPAFGPAQGQQLSNADRVADEFVRTHRLTSISNRMVVIDDRPLPIGAEPDDPAGVIDGFRVTGTYQDRDTRGVVLQSGQISVRLPLK